MAGAYRGILQHIVDRLHNIGNNLREIGWNLPFLQFCRTFAPLVEKKAESVGLEHEKGQFRLGVKLGKQLVLEPRGPFGVRSWH